MYRTIFFSMLLGSCVSLTACQSMTGKTADQTMSDATITAKVQGTLTGDKLSNFSRIDVDTEQSEVTLNGVVQSAEEKRRAAELAREVSGVTKVNNNLQIQSASTSTP